MLQNQKKDFIPGLELSEKFFEELVQPILKDNFPNLKYAAALLGEGSEVLGFDDLTSTDHDWGPRLLIFLSEEDYSNISSELKEIFSKKLPYTFLGYSTNWGEPDPNDSMTQVLKPVNEGRVNHRIEIHTVNAFLLKNLGIDSLDDLSEFKWLLFSEQKLLEITSGKIFYDSSGELTKARTTLGNYYPENVWYFKLLSEWEHIAQERAFVGRLGSIGDDLGSRIETARIVRFIIRLSFLLSKTYIPYPKWLGMSFKNLEIAKELNPILLKCLREQNWREREKYLCDAYLILLDN
ncbi:MAG: DUF4037 domain-containing protein, partial [Promethearchaeota archaeon]